MLKEKLPDVLEFVRGKGLTPVLVGYVGSQHLGLEDEQSDLDYLVYTVPTLEELLLNVTQNKSYTLEGDVSVVINSLNSVAKSLHKLPFNVLEIVSDVLYVDEDFKGVLTELQRVLGSYGGNKHLEKNIFFVGLRYYENCLKEPQQGSGLLHYRDGVNLKALAKADFNYRYLTEYLKSGVGVYEDYSDKGSKRQELVDRYHRVRQGEAYTEWDELGSFYSKEMITNYVSGVRSFEVGAVHRKMSEYLQGYYSTQ